VKIITLNLRGFFDWDARLPHILSYLAREQPDLVLLQEVVYLPDISPYSNADLLNHAAAFPHRHSAIDRMQPSKQYGLYREGLSVLSQLPVIQSETIILRHQDPDPHQRLVQFIDLEGDAVVKLANVHFSIRDDFAVNNLREVLGMLEARGEQRIIAGDFNVNHLEKYAHLWRDDYVVSTQLISYVSFPDSNQANDYFLVPKEYELKSITVSEDGLSDHRALAAEITRAAADTP
jgi:endonuclease/exonuclease/phosphatase family metal-dependent hydrolase